MKHNCNRAGHLTASCDASCRRPLTKRRFGGLWAIMRFVAANDIQKSNALSSIPRPTRAHLYFQANVYLGANCCHHGVVYTLTMSYQQQAWLTQRLFNHFTRSPPMKVSRATLLGNLEAAIAGVPSREQDGAPFRSNNFSAEVIADQSSIKLSLIL